ncbi:ABC transporter permease [Fulvimarina sp. 2208YS6-2-32]|uniref:ABC transporter permease n=1 Tax=Fulvimarina uroteuthidis TaxID=3098149 RepID=A0ABU5HYD0_9HYPH|nr:ABC transporter permease [Fulvimarina sp. 2208YS6-2-32]MDY8107966.1 ABC transporter permease [Fulvimarina sp. 2208YS6-2-32]
MSNSLARLQSVWQSAPFAFAFVGAGIIFAVTLAANQGSGAGQIVSAALAFGSFYALVGIGQMFVITSGPGNIDLSVPANIALSGAVAMKVMAGSDAMIAVGVLAALGCGTAIGTANYALISVLRIPPIIATLSSSFVVQSLAIVYGRGLRISPPPLLADIATNRVAGLPILSILVIALAAVMAIVLHRSVYGRFLTAIGQNMNAANLAGIQVGLVRYATYVLCALFAALCGVMLAAFSGGASLNMGEEYLLASIAVVVIGGTSVAGGFSNVSGVWGAALFLYLLVTMMNTFGVGSGLRQILTGLIIVAVITLAGGKRGARD